MMDFYDTDELAEFLAESRRFRERTEEFFKMMIEKRRSWRGKTKIIDVDVAAFLKVGVSAPGVGQIDLSKFSTVDVLAKAEDFDRVLGILNFEIDKLCGLDPVWPEVIEGEFISSAELLADGQQASL